MEYNICKLANGLRVIHLPSQSQVLYCGYQFAAGTRDELPGEEGLAHFCEHVTFKGTAHRSAFQILNCMERVGGDLNAFTNKESTVYYVAVLREHLTTAVSLLTDMVFHATYPDSEIEKEKEIICDEIESYHDTPSELIYDEIENLVFAGHPLGHNILGTAERVRSFGREDAVRFTRNFYRPDNAVFFAYGDISFRRLVQLLCKAGQTQVLSLGDTPATSVVRPSSMANWSFPSSEGRQIVCERHTHQAHVMVASRAYSAYDDRRLPLFLLNNLVGGPGMNSKLNVSLRERHGLVYTVDSSVVNYGDTGIWSVYFGCDYKDVNRCLRLVRRELDKLMQRPLRDAQLAAAKRQLKGQLGVSFDNRENFAISFGKSFLHYGKERDIEQLYASIDRITVQEMWEVAQEIFAPARCYTLIYK